MAAAALTGNQLDPLRWQRLPDTILSTYVTSAYGVKMLTASLCIRVAEIYGLGQGAR